MPHYYSLGRLTGTSIRLTIGSQQLKIYTKYRAQLNEQGVLLFHTQFSFLPVLFLFFTKERTSFSSVLFIFVRRQTLERKKRAKEFFVPSNLSLYLFIYYNIF